MAFSLPLLRRRHRDIRVPVLTYHALHAPGTDYTSNDHVALEEDLKVIARLGFGIADLPTVAAAACGNARALPEGRWVGLSFDDGTDYDFLDIELPDLGLLKSFRRILHEAEARGDVPMRRPAGLSFVIASPGARDTLDRTCIAGRGNWRDVWWEDAAVDGLLGIGNHSWDHTHPSLDTVAQREQRKGTFHGIDNEADADAQIVQAERYIQARTGGRSQGLFAYPYGDAPDYLVDEHFPRHVERHGQAAAFVLTGAYVTAGANRWKLPRFSCGSDWRSPAELERILQDAIK